MTSKATYQALARQWRPRSFADMIGQDTIVRLFTNALTQQRIHHAYLLTGTRGVGKTTLARIYAKCLNCETGITPTPCGTCNTCQAIDAGQCLDIYEVDAASRTKVEDTRELLDNVLYPPTSCRYKIYLIDEVHMLSNHSFNALLKTLEEPPLHVKFILATTDPKKLPVTILSRCLQFHLTRIAPHFIADHLAHICAAEKISTEDAALASLAQAADGSMRDALSLLDQAIAYGQGTVHAAEVHAMLGSTAPDAILPLITALADQSGAELFQVMAKLSEHAPDFQQLLGSLIGLLHQIALLQIVPEYANPDPALLALAQKLSPEEVQLYYQIALLGRRDLAYSPNPQQGFEMTLLRMLAFKPLKGAPEPTPSHSTKTSTPKASETAKEAVTAPQEAQVQVVSTTNIDWRDLVPKLGLTGMAHALASNCMIEKLTDQHLTLALASNHKPMLNPKLKERLAEALKQYFKQTIQLDIHLSDNALHTPVKQAAEEHELALQKAKNHVLEDPHVQQLVNMYDATVSVSLVKESG